LSELSRLITDSCAAGEEITRCSCNLKLIILLITSGRWTQSRATLIHSASSKYIPLRHTLLCHI